MDNVGKETQGGSLRGFVIGRRNNYLREATPSELELLQDLYVDSCMCKKHIAKKNLVNVRICIIVMAKKWMKIGIKLCPNLALFIQLERS